MGGSLNPVTLEVWTARPAGAAIHGKARSAGAVSCDTAAALHPGLL